MIHVFDIEVFAYDWLIVFKSVPDGEYTILHNDNHAVKTFLTADKLLAGFNNKFYDNHVLKAILCGADNALVKEVNDYIIAGNLGFTHWFLKQNKAWFDSFDLRDDMQQGLSLKAIEGHFGMKIEESNISFDIDRPLSSKELAETIHYCKHDVDTTEKLLHLRKSYLQGKLSLGRMKGVSDTSALYSTNAKMTALFLDATPKEHCDERNYTYPSNLKKEKIPKEVLRFFDQVQDESIPSEVLFKSKLEFMLGTCPSVAAFGGIHGAMPNYMEESEE